MLSSAMRWIHHRRDVRERRSSRTMVKLLGMLLFISMLGLELSPFSSYRVYAQEHTKPTADYACQHVTYSADGNPFPLCPGPFPLGGNCVWWVWEQWHLLGYDLPVNWGNAADWIVDAERAGFSVGTVPRVGSIAVFPRADGVWASSADGHAAFVTSVKNNGATFDVTYQNYGDATFMYVGTDFAVATINQPVYQAGLLRFIYFPRDINAQSFLQLPGIGNNDPAAAVQQANHQSASASGSTSTTDRIALGLSPASSDQEFNADFTGDGLNNLLLYNRQKGSLDILKLNAAATPAVPPAMRTHLIGDDGPYHPAAPPPPSQIISLGDSITAANQWGSSLDIHLGDFSGSGKSEILLYDRLNGTIQLLSLNTDLTIQKHATLSNIGTGWELYAGRFDGQRSGLFMYKRSALPYAPVVNAAHPAAPTPVATPTLVPTPEATATPIPTPTALPTVCSTPTATAAVSASVTPAASVQVAVSPVASVQPGATASPTVTAPAGTCPQPAATPTATVIASPTATATVQASPTATATVSPTVTATAASPTATAAPTPTPAQTPKVVITPTATPAPTATATVKATAVPHAIPTATATGTATPHGNVSPFAFPTSATVGSPDNTDLSGIALQDWEKQGRQANILLLDFNQDFSISHSQQYTLWHANWEVYTGRFVNAQQDAIFLYDRSVGEGRLLDFNAQLAVVDYKAMHNLSGNWEVYSGDFANAGRSQMLLYDPSSGNVRFLSFNEQLDTIGEKAYAHFGMHQVLYVGHFGMPTVSVMFYDPPHAQSTFFAFDQSLNIGHQYLVQTWDQHHQILVGSFIDHTRCSAQDTCTKGDDILVLNRQNGQIEQYEFSFGRQFQVYDNRTQAFIRQGIGSSQHINSVDTTRFSLLNTLSTSIHDEELY